MMKKPISKIIDGKRVIVKKPELLAPAGNLEKLKVAVLYGADAVFIGGKEFSLRSLASNFPISEIEEAVKFAHSHGCKVHVTCNIVLHNENLEGIKEYLMALDKAGVDAIIVADIDIMMIAKSLNPAFEIHVSTQTSTLNSKAVEFYHDLGVDRVVLGRETSYENLRSIMEQSPVDIEYFIHGAMCINYSGRCMLSNYFSARDANRGGCSQSCRWYYDLFENGNKLNDETMPPFSMSSKDMCLINQIDKLIEIGVDSFKIEGRMKSIHYIATVVSTYRKLVDAYCEDPDNFVMSDFYKDELFKAANRATCEGFFDGSVDENDQLFNLRDEHPTQDFCMRVVAFDHDAMMATVEQRNYFKVGDEVEFFSPKHENRKMTITQIKNSADESVGVANHPMELLQIKVDFPLDVHDMARKLRK